MPGFLTNVFGSGAERDVQQSEHGAAEDSADLELNPSVHTEMSASYETSDGTTHSYANSEDVSATIGVHAAFATTADATHDAGTATDGF